MGCIVTAYADPNPNDKMRRSSIDVQAWTVRRLVSAIDGVGNERIFIPSFQRDFVWSADKQRDLIESIRTLKPVGALLFYDDGIHDGKQQFQIVDGLQRSTTLRDYETDVFATYTADEADDEFITTMLDALDVAGESAAERRLAEKRLRSAITTWIRNRRSFSPQDGFRTASLLKQLAQAAGRDDALANATALDLTEEYLERLRKELEIGDYRIPVVIFSGDKRLLPDIFEKLNTRGVKLNKFDILASSWSERTLDVTVKALVDAAALRRKDLNSGTVQRLTTKPVPGRYELYDAVCSFGIVLVEDHKRLFTRKRAWKPSDPVSAGFNLVALSFALSLSDIDRVPKYLGEFESPDAYFTSLFDACNEVERTLGPAMLGSFEAAKAPTTHTELQMASIIASVFRAQVGRGAASYLSEAERGRHLQQHYLWDALRREWTGTGDTKAVRAVGSERYAAAVAKSLFYNTARAWHGEHVSEAASRGKKWLDAPALALLRAYLYACDVDDAALAQTLYVVPAQPSVSILCGTPNVISNVRITNAAGLVLADPGSALPALTTAPTAQQVRHHLDQRFNVMLDKIALKYQFANEA